MVKRFVLLFVILIGAIPASVANAHSPIDKRSPNVNEVLDTVPDKVELYFKDPVQIHRSSIVVRNEKQIEVQVGKPYLDPKNNRHILVDLQKALPSGTYSVDIDVVSMDGHAIREKYLFEIKLAFSTPEERFQRLRLEQTFPEDGTIVKTSPKTIELWYNEPVELDFALLNDKQQLLQTGLPVADPANPNHFVLKLNDELPAGTYTILSYPRIGDNVKVDTVYFAVEKMTAVTGINKYSRVTLWSQIGSLQVAHWIAYLGLLALLGGNWFQKAIAKKSANLSRWKLVSNILYALSLAAILLELVLNKAEYSEVVLSDFLRFNFVWMTLLQVGFVVSSLIVKRLRIYFLLLSVLCLALTGHSVDPGYGGVWATVLDAIHLLGSSIWIGGLIGLISMMPKEKPIIWLKETGKSFAKWALFSFIGIGVSGVFMTIIYVPSFSFTSLIMSFWGQALAFKILLFVVIVIIAIWQRRLLKQMAKKLAGSFQRNLKIELFIAAILLFAAGVLVDLAPREAVQGIFPKSQTKNGVTAKIEIAPLVAGGNVLTIRLDDNKDVSKVTARIYTSLGGAEANNTFNMGNGVYKLTGNLFHTAGEYKLEIKVIKKNGEQIVFSPFTIKVPGIMPNDIEFEKEG